MGIFYDTLSCNFSWEFNSENNNCGKIIIKFGFVGKFTLFVNWLYNDYYYIMLCVFISWYFITILWFSWFYTVTILPTGGTWNILLLIHLPVSFNSVLGTIIYHHIYTFLLAYKMTEHNKTGERKSIILRIFKLYC